MGYQNVSRREAERILAGKEKDPDHDRYEKPAEWPKLSSTKREPKKSEATLVIRKTITYEESREDNKQRRTITYRDRIATNNNKQANRNN